MELEQIGTLITQYGFPIAVCLICFWYINKKDETHKEEVGTLREAIENNTAVLQQLLAKLDK